MKKDLPTTEPIKLDDLKVEYERFFTVSLDMLCISSYDGHFKKVNPAFSETLGFSSEELCTKSYLDFIHPDDIERTVEEVKKQLFHKQQVLSFENRYRCKDGSYKWLSWKSAPVGNFMYAAARDMTQSMQSKEALEAVNRELEAFSYSVAHDLRTPVRTILGFSTLALEDPESSLGQSAKVHLSRVISAGKKMGVLIDGLLSLSRLAKQDLAKSPTNLSLMAREIADDLQASEPTRKVEFSIAPGVIINADPFLLRVVMNNLLENSWKYTSKANRNVVIEFGTMIKDNCLVLYVRDNGAGFEMQYANKLFGPFQRLHSEQEFEGNGIGLVSVQRIILRHGGRIWAESEVDKNTTFYFTISSDARLGKK